MISTMMIFRVHVVYGRDINIVLQHSMIARIRYDAQPIDIWRKRERERARARDSITELDIMPIINLSLENYILAWESYDP